MAYAEMTEFHRIHLFEFHRNHSVGILFLVALVAIFFLVIGAFSRSRRSSSQRAMQTGPPSAAARPSPVGVCQRCRSAIAIDAVYCGRCGLPVTRPTPLPMPPQRIVPGNSRWLIYLLIALLGLGGFAAFWFMSDSDSEQAPAQSVQPYAPSDSR